MFTTSHGTYRLRMKQRNTIVNCDPLLLNFVLLLACVCWLFSWGLCTGENLTPVVIHECSLLFIICSECLQAHTVQRKGREVAQWVERPTEKPRRNTDAGSSVRCGKRFFSQSQPAFGADSPTVSVQPPGAIACINFYAYFKNLRHWLPYHCLDTRKCCTHWMEEWVALLLRLLCLTLGFEPTPWLFCRTVYQLNYSRPILL